MTFTARFKVQDVGEGPAPINVLAVASVEDGTLTTNTEKARSMELRIVIDADETSLAEGDELYCNGHFSATAIGPGTT
jgi:hypothetical protein